MTWTNIYDLGSVELLWEDADGDLNPLGTLVEGTIEEVDGVIVCTDIRTPYDGLGFPQAGGVVAIVARPLFDAGELPMRLSVPSINRPVAPGASSVNPIGAVGTAIGGVFTATNSVALTPTVESEIVVGLVPDSEVALGTTPASNASGRFQVVDNLT